MRLAFVDRPDPKPPIEVYFPRGPKAMRLLIATDHQFLRNGNEVFDSFCFDVDFFKDYRSVFDSISVLCRTREVDAVPDGARRSSCAEITFVDAPNVHGAKWLFLGERICRKMVYEAVSRAEAVVGRVPSQLGWQAARMAQKLGKPFMVEIIGNPLQGIQAIGKGAHYRILAHWQSRRIRNLSSKASAVSYVSSFCLPELYPVRSGTPWDAISSIRLEADQIGRPRHYKSPVNKTKVVMVASLLPYKRHGDLIRAYALARSKGFVGEVHLAGDGPLRATLESMVRDLTLEDSVIFHGHIADRNELIELLDDSDLFVLTSGTEGLPRVVIEAMSRGLPSLGTKIGGIEELVRRTELFNVGDVKALAGLLVSLPNDPDRLSELSHYSIQTARRYAAESLSPKRVRLYTHLKDLARNAQISNVN